MTGDRKLEWDWYPGRVPDNVSLDEKAYLETTYSFLLFRSEASRAVEIGAGTSIYLGTMFDVGRAGRVKIGKCALLNGARIQCDAAVTFGDYALISWNVVLMDSYRVPVNPELRRRALEAAVRVSPRRVAAGDGARPIHVGANVWIGFDCCVLPGVTIGDGSIVGARSVVADDVPPRTIVAGSPARVIRELTSGERQTNDETR